ncbi:enoyl-CoA hydratase-related protein [Nannocystis pusilla]|uniref:enoyl-CoA hydratase-related protein n=1 Tax=Nannocystis pusilla TaxID=889268 RepID=UPI003B7F3037
MELTDVRYDLEGATALVTLDRPAARNAYSEAMVESLVHAIDLAERDDAVRCVILTGAGPAFSAGGDLKRMLNKEGMFAGGAAELRRRYVDGIQRISRRLALADKPIVAALNGAAIGAGLDLACMCDLRLAARGAQFGSTFVKVGLVPGDGGAYFLARAIGFSRALELMLTARVIDCDEALRIGLVHRVVEPDELLPAARALASELAALPPSPSASPSAPPTAATTSASTPPSSSPPPTRAWPRPPPTTARPSPPCSSAARPASPASDVNLRACPRGMPHGSCLKERVLSARSVAEAVHRPSISSGQSLLLHASLWSPSPSQNGRHASAHGYPGTHPSGLGRHTKDRSVQMPSNCWMHTSPSAQPQGFSSAVVASLVEVGVPVVLLVVGVPVELLPVVVPGAVVPASVVGPVVALVPSVPGPHPAVRANATRARRSNMGEPGMVSRSYRRHGSTHTNRPKIACLPIQPLILPWLLPI